MGDVISRRMNHRVKKRRGRRGGKEVWALHSWEDFCTLDAFFFFEGFLVCFAFYFSFFRFRVTF